MKTVRLLSGPELAQLRARLEAERNDNANPVGYHGASSLCTLGLSGAEEFGTPPARPMSQSRTNRRGVGITAEQQAARDGAEMQYRWRRDR